MEMQYCVHCVTFYVLVDCYMLSYKVYIVPLLCLLRDSDILEKCGPDAVQYLSFQRYLLVYLSIITVLSISVVLPINFQGELGK